MFSVIIYRRYGLGYTMEFLYKFAMLLKFQLVQYIRVYFNYFLLKYSIHIKKTLTNWILPENPNFSYRSLSDTNTSC